MENDEIHSHKHIKLDPEQHIHAVCKIIDHAQHTKFKYIDLNLLKSDVLEKNNHYSYLLGILRKYKEQTGVRNNRSLVEMKVMVELSEMLQTCKLLSPVVLDGFLKKVIDWYSRRQSGESQIVTKLLEINSQRSKSTGRKKTEQSGNINYKGKQQAFQRPKTGVLRKKDSKHLAADRPNSAIFGNLNYHKYRPFSGALTNASTRITKNMSVNDQTVEIMEKSQFGEQSQEIEQEQRDDDDIEEIEGDKIKLYAWDHESDQNMKQPYPQRRGDFQHTKQGDLILHQILGNQMIMKESKQYKSRKEAKQIQEMVEAYKKNRIRGISQSYRRIQSAKVFRNIKPSVGQSKFKEQSKQNRELQQKQNNFTTEIINLSTCQNNPKKQQFSMQRPLSAMIRPWKGEVTSHIPIYLSPKSKFQNQGYSLTRPISAIPHRTIFQPLDQKYVRQTNIIAYDQIEKIKMLLGKNTDVTTRQLSKALVYDEWELQQNFVKPNNQLMNNPFLKKKKKKVLKKKKKII